MFIEDRHRVHQVAARFLLPIPCTAHTGSRTVAPSAEYCRSADHDACGYRRSQLQAGQGPPEPAAASAAATERTERGTAFGIFYALYSLGAVGGAGLAGAVTQWQGQVAGLPFLAAAPAVLLAVPAVLLWAPVPQRKG